MLIVPLHKKPTLATFPWITALLVLVNVFIYVAIQRPDDARAERAALAYADSRLAEIELPAYADYIERTPTISWREQWRALPSDLRQSVLAMQIHGDERFLTELRAGRIITAEHPDHDEWRALRDRLDATWRPSFTERHVMRQSELDFGRIGSAMFLHGSYGHLIGNMIFLVLLGLVVEPVLGAARYLGLYLLAGLGGGLFSLAWRWGDSGAMLGASGAIAGLMGAYAVLWGLRRVRLFYWVFIWFDYTRVRALWLLPVWLGWELAQLLLMPNAGIGFDAHAGGILTGAVLAFGCTRLGWINRGYLDEDETRDRRAEGLADGLAALGKLQLPVARAQFDALIGAHPDDPDIIEPWLRSWLFAKDRPEAKAATRHALRWPPRGRLLAQRQQGWYAEASRAFGPGAVADAETLLLVVQRWARFGMIGEARDVLVALESREPTLDRLPATWFLLALAAQEQRDEAATRAALAHVRSRYPQSPEAGKATLLLG